MTQVRKSKPLADGEWVPPKIILAKLNLSRDKLQSLHQQGVFTNGVHWLDINPYSEPRYRYHLERCQERLKQLRKESDRLSNGNGN